MHSLVGPDRFQGRIGHQGQLAALHVGRVLVAPSCEGHPLADRVIDGDGELRPVVAGRVTDLRLVVHEHDLMDLLVLPDGRQFDIAGRHQPVSLEVRGGAVGPLLEVLGFGDGVVYGDGELLSFLARRLLQDGLPVHESDRELVERPPRGLYHDVGLEYAGRSVRNGGSVDLPCQEDEALLLGMPEPDRHSVAVVSAALVQDNVAVDVLDREFVQGFPRRCHRDVFLDLQGVSDAQDLPAEGPSEEPVSRLGGHVLLDGELDALLGDGGPDLGASVHVGDLVLLPLAPLGAEGHVVLGGHDVSVVALGPVGSLPFGEDPVLGDRVGEVDGHRAPLGDAERPVGAYAVGEDDGERVGRPPLGGDSDRVADDELLPVLDCCSGAFPAHEDLPFGGRGLVCERVGRSGIDLDGLQDGVPVGHGDRVLGQVGPSCVKFRIGGYIQLVSPDVLLSVLGVPSVEHLPFLGRVVYGDFEENPLQGRRVVHDGPAVPVVDGVLGAVPPLGLDGHVRFDRDLGPRDDAVGPSQEVQGLGERVLLLERVAPAVVDVRGGQGALAVLDGHGEHLAVLEHGLERHVVIDPHRRRCRDAVLGPSYEPLADLLGHIEAHVGLYGHVVGYRGLREDGTVRLEVRELESLGGLPYAVRGMGLENGYLRVGGVGHAVDHPSDMRVPFDVRELVVVVPVGEPDPGGQRRDVCAVRYGGVVHDHVCLPERCGQDDAAAPGVRQVPGDLRHEPGGAVGLPSAERQLSRGRSGQRVGQIGLVQQDHRVHAQPFGQVDLDVPEVHHVVRGPCGRELRTVVRGAVVVLGHVVAPVDGDDADIVLAVEGYGDLVPGLVHVLDRAAGLAADVLVIAVEPADPRDQGRLSRLDHLEGQGAAAEGGGAQRLYGPEVGEPQPGVHERVVLDLRDGGRPQGYVVEAGRVLEGAGPYRCEGAAHHDDPEAAVLERVVPDGDHVGGLYGIEPRAAQEGVVAYGLHIAR